MNIGVAAAAEDSQLGEDEKKKGERKAERRVKAQTLFIACRVTHVLNVATPMRPQQHSFLVLMARKCTSAQRAVAMNTTRNTVAGKQSAAVVQNASHVCVCVSESERCAPQVYSPQRPTIISPLPYHCQINGAVLCIFHAVFGRTSLVRRRSPSNSVANADCKDQRCLQV